MSIRAVIAVLLFGAILGGVVYVALANETTLVTPITYWGEHRLSVWATIVSAFFIGFTLAFGLSTVRSSQQALERMREARAARQRERVERSYATGLQALLAEQPERAEEQFREVLARSPQHFEGLMTYGDMLRDQGRGRESSDLHRRAMQARPQDMRPLFALAADGRATANVEEAQTALEKVIAVHPKESLKARRELRQLLMDSRRWDEARKVHDRLEAEAKEGADRDRERRIGLGIRYEIARAQQAAGGRDAEREYRAILKGEPNFVPALVALGELLIERGDEELGVKEWRRGFEQTESPVFLRRMEDFYLKRERPEELIGVMRQLVAGARTRTIPAFHLAKLYQRLEMIDDAEQAFASLEDAAPDSILLRYYSGRIMERRGRLKEAAAAYRGVIKTSQLLDLEFGCRECLDARPMWEARCTKCGAWGTIDALTERMIRGGAADAQGAGAARG